MTVLLFPLESVACQVTKVVPTGNSNKEGALCVMETGKISVAVAEPMTRKIGLLSGDAAKIATGALMTGSVVSTNTTCCTVEAVFPALSVAE